MSQRRAARAEAEIADLEAEFRAKLIVALRTCAEGRWGLFGHNEHLLPDRSREAEELLEIGISVEALRRKAGMPEPFELFRAFKSKRGRQGHNALGEARLAKKWLEELGESA